MPVLPYLLALAVFAQGTSEFMVSGLVPEVARDLGVSPATAGSLTAVFAVGMVVGAPVLAVAGRGWPRRGVLLGYLGVFIAVHVAGALAPGFGILLGTRLVAALATAGLLAVALTAAADAAPGGEGRATAVVLAGTTLACIAGVPAGAVLGQVWGWRSAFWAVALVSVPAFAAIARWAPTTETANTPVRAEFAVLKRPRVLAALGRGALVNGATFAVFTYLAPIANSESRLPVLLALFGIGACAGVALAGRRPATRKTQVALAVGWLALVLGTGNATVLLVLVPLQALLSFAVGSTAVAQVLRAAPDAPALRGAFATAALNVGAAAGPGLAAALIGTGYRAPVWLAAVLATAALAIREQCS
ncbi:MFS transporter [Amycolatopsis carbonis]|uniref:MFS transporter n=1 Tax=Amycolatopsis carbonis TaxID=715471 RepID=A0A9Y2IG35_9PSEU|nr:MFS transporter [Amycolatopsis sp. 2-15]WIX77728.1 MFS transporter [Amycolatopsis sp. 2-15]